MKQKLVSLLCTLYVISGYAQEKRFQVSIRLPFQYEIQKADVKNSIGTTEIKGHALNFGLDALANYNINKISVYAGIGYMRNRINLKRAYDHRALNEGFDSLPIGTYTDNYIYSLLRFPMGVRIDVFDSKDVTFGLGLEDVINFSFRRKYNGKLPYEGANNVYKGFDYYGNSINLFFSIRKKRVQAEPYVRLVYHYKKDRFLFESENESYKRNMDAFGLALRYYLPL